ncbi:MAG: DeoR/GlpR family DNA-binding transcription regulator [Paracoccus sp. (in: a-proteobacteria)]|uniref:DeoR/GlpR family DNA-binding transcription regulator n=1 Tax=Paracoccus sp. TaxID=267 RepID=UPI0039E3421F
MSDSDRQAQIVALLGEQPFASVRELQKLVGASGATIRRDIEKLNETGRARKVYGGVAAMERSLRPADLPFVENRDIAVSAKRAIAREAEKLVQDGTAIVVHGGSTCFHFGCRMAERNLRVLTYSMPLAAYLSEFGLCQLDVLGGALHRAPGVMYDAAMRPDFYAAQFFVGALGIGEQGVLEQHPLLVRLSDEMSRRANETVVLADSRKFGIRPPTVALPFSRVARLVTDDGLSDAHAKLLERAGVQIIIAKNERET